MAHAITTIGRGPRQVRRTDSQRRASRKTGISTDTDASDPEAPLMIAR
jgi:hypothetical protein